MKNRITLLSAAVLVALAQVPFISAAQAPKPAAAASSPVPAPASTPKASVAAKSPTEWIQYDDTTFTPVLDDVSSHLAAARAALVKKDFPAASKAMQEAASALKVQGDHAGKVDSQLAAADMKLARDSHARMAALARKLDAAAQQIKAGKVTTTAALDKTIDKASRADLERRWLVSDVTTWYPVIEEPQRHFTAAAEDFAKKDYEAAAIEARKAEAYLRLESARATGDARKSLDTATAGLEKAAQALDKGAVKTEKNLDKSFASADHALALAHRAKAAESWARKAYDNAGYELKASAQSLESAATWAGAESKAEASMATADARAVGDKLASGGVWAKDEVTKGFDSLRSAINKLGQSIGAKVKASPFDLG